MWLVEYEQIVWFEHKTRHSQTRALAAREHLDLLVDVLAAEEECAEYVAQTRAYIAHGNSVERVEDGKLAVHKIVLILGVVAYVDVGSDTYLALGGRQLAREHACQRGLALAVAAYESYLRAALDRELCSREYVLGAERLADALYLGHDLSRAGCGRELYVEAREILLVDLDALDAFELLYARLHLIALGGLVAELLDELLGLLDHALLVLVGGQLLAAALGAQLDELGVGHLVVVYLAQRQLDGACGDVIQKCAVVRYEQHGAVV